MVVFFLTWRVGKCCLVGKELFKLKFKVERGEDCVGFSGCSSICKVNSMSEINWESRDILK